MDRASWRGAAWAAVFERCRWKLVDLVGTAERICEGVGATSNHPAWIGRRLLRHRCHSFCASEGRIRFQALRAQIRMARYRSARSRLSQSERVAGNRQVLGCWWCMEE